MKNLTFFVFYAAVILTFWACEDNGTETGNGSDPVNGNTEQYYESYNITVDEAMSENKNDHEKSKDYIWNEANSISIVLNGDEISASGTGVSVEGSIATISSGGDYLISGTLNDGRIIVDCDDTLTVRLILNNVNITSTKNAPISIMSAEKTVIILADNSENFVTDPAEYVFDDPEDDEPNAAVYSKDDLSIYGTGILNVDANYNDGITSKDGLVINSGNINVSAADDGIRGKDYLVIKSGTITINSDGDALKSDNDDDADRGYILVEEGNIDITAGADGLDAETDALIAGGTINIKTGGGSSVSPGDNSTKGIKGGKWAVVSGGDLNINSSDDAIHSNSRIVLNNGEFNISTGDDAVHADSSLVINDGTIDITKCVEGIESYVIAVNGGNISVVASDDCFNSTAGTKTEFDDNSCTYIYGGYIVLNTNGGDALDSNGSIVMTDGTVIIHGPSNDPEVIVDYNGSFNISGGMLVGSGSGSRMTQSPGSSSEQNSVITMASSSISASTIFRIEDSDGNNIVTFQPLRRYQTFLYSSSLLVTGKTYSIYEGGSCSGTNIDGVYSDGTYSGGTKVKDFSVSGRITVLSY